MIPVEISQALMCVLNFIEEDNDRTKVKNLDFSKKDKEMSHIRSVAYKERVKKYFDKYV